MRRGPDLSTVGALGGQVGPEHPDQLGIGMIVSGAGRGIRSHRGTPYPERGAPLCAPGVGG